MAGGREQCSGLPDQPTHLEVTSEAVQLKNQWNAVSMKDMMALQLLQTIVLDSIYALGYTSKGACTHAFYSAHVLSPPVDQPFIRQSIGYVWKL